MNKAVKPGELNGLPIGPEASAVLSNFILRPIDNLIAMTGVQSKGMASLMLHQLRLMYQVKTGREEA